MSLQLNDPTIPSPGELQESHDHNTMSPHSLTHSPIAPAGDRHIRAPSLGEIHQELEQEQEAQVVRSNRVGTHFYILIVTEPSAPDDPDPTATASTDA